MKLTIEQIGDLLAAKRPEDGYWQDFLCDFHRKQREQPVMKSEWIRFVTDITDGFFELSTSRWTYGVGLVYAAVTVVIFQTQPNVVKVNTPVSPENYQVVPALTAPAVDQLDPLDLSPTIQESVDGQVFEF